MSYALRDIFIPVVWQGENHVPSSIFFKPPGRQKNTVKIPHIGKIPYFGIK
jgi:hypothetical protein